MWGKQKVLSKHIKIKDSVFYQRKVQINSGKIITEMRT